MFDVDAIAISCNLRSLDSDSSNLRPLALAVSELLAGGILGRLASGPFSSYDIVVLL